MATVCLIKEETSNTIQSNAIMCGDLGISERKQFLISAVILRHYVQVDWSNTVVIRQPMNPERGMSRY